jgi:UDP-N-acetylglucosamine--N-acetylmuramyl-(pentapeptide) pyrophosphoryl-undecaprenol N-acetylglucosamine transferase
MTPQTAPKIAIACGGTGGHLFPGLAVAEQLVARGCRVTLLISPKEVDQQAVQKISGMEIVTLPAVGLTRGRVIAFASGFIKSYRAAKKHFRTNPPLAALAMGGFTSAPPVLAARSLGAQTFLHESNTIPGRANRWLSRVVNQAFVGFSQAARRLHTRAATTTGTPVRPEFYPRDSAACRAALGLDPALPVLLVMGGSQGATGINNLVIHSLPSFRSAAVCAAPAAAPGNKQHAAAGSSTTTALRSIDLQFLHITGAGDAERVRRAYAEKNLRAIVLPFLAEMHLALGAASVAVSRAGASSLAELAAMRVPSVLVPFPAATDNHQFFNARAFEATGAARLLEQKNATPESLTGLVSEMISNDASREKMKTALANWHAPKAAEQIAETILCAVLRSADSVVRANQAAGEAGGQGRPHSDTPERQNFSTA